MVIVPDRPEQGFNFPRLPGAVADGFDEDRDGDFEFSAGLGGELAAERDGGGEFGNGINIVVWSRGSHGIVGFRGFQAGVWTRLELG